MLVKVTSTKPLAASSEGTFYFWNFLKDLMVSLSDPTLYKQNSHSQDISDSYNYSVFTFIPVLLFIRQ